MKETSVPLAIIVGAARKNLVPALIAQAVLFAVVASYYGHAPTRSALERLAELKAAAGYAFSFMAGVLAGAVMPELLSILVFQRGVFRPENASNLRFTIFFWGLDGVLVDAFYRLQGVMFGQHVNWQTVAVKVLVDQFAFTPLIATPLGLACYEWKHRAYSFSRFSRAFTWRFYLRRAIPAVITNWLVWIPILVAVYSLPALLQIPIFAVALTLWVMLFTFISKADRIGI